MTYLFYAKGRRPRMGPLSTAPQVAQSELFGSLWWIVTGLQHGGGCTERGNPSLFGFIDVCEYDCKM